MRKRFIRFLGSCLVVLAVPACLHGELVRAGSEFQVNTYIFSFQRYPGVAVDNEGDFVVAWTSYGQDGHARGVFARRFSSSGAALATEFQVNSYTSSSQGYPVGDFRQRRQLRRGLDQHRSGRLRLRGLRAALQLRGHAAGHRVPRQRLHLRQPIGSGRSVQQWRSRSCRRRQRWLRGGLAQFRAGRQRERHIRPALRCHRRGSGAGVHGQQLHQLVAELPHARPRRQRRLRRHLAESRPGRGHQRDLRASLHVLGQPPGRRVPGQQPNLRHPALSQRGSRRQRRLRHRLAELRPGRSERRNLCSPVHLERLGVDRRSPDQHVHHSGAALSRCRPRR